MAVDLGNYTESFLYEINPPGVNNYPGMSTTEMINRMRDAFWELRLSGLDFLAGWDCTEDGVITPNGRAGYYPGFTIPDDWYTDDGTPDLGREVIQAIILFAGYRVALTTAQNLATMQRSQAGPVSFEIQKSSALQQQVLKAIVAKIDIVLTRLSDLGTTSVMVLDQVLEKTDAVDLGYDWWPRG